MATEGSSWRDARGPATTVIVATYDQPEPLRLVLASLSAQTDPSFDVIVADDGSAPSSQALVERAAAELGLHARVVWQPDDGFRKARAQNRAALETDAELLVFLDGDCLAFRDLVAQYRSKARPREFCVGAVVFLDSASTRSLAEPAVRAGAHERALTLRERLRAFDVHWRNALNLAGRLERPRIRGGNFAVSADLFREVDGYDEVFGGFGKEDSDLRNRMRNAGARGISLWHRAFVAHLARDVVRRAGFRERPPADLYREGKLRVRARTGLSSHTGAGALAETAT
ncbi:MAG: glycosyltransferase [Myxococcota bacterium]